MNQFGTTDRENLRQYQERLARMGEEFDLNILVDVIRKAVPLILLFYLLAFAGAFLYLRYTPPLYEVKSVLQINSQNTAIEVLNIENIYEMDLAHEIELLRSTSFIEKALDKLDLEISYFAKGQILNFEQYTSAPYKVEVANIQPTIYEIPVYISFPDTSQFYLSYTIQDEVFQVARRLGQWDSTPHFRLKVRMKDFSVISEQQNAFKANPYFFVINPPSYLREFPKLINVQILNSASQTILVSYSDHNANKATDIINAISRSFIEYDVEKKAAGAEKILTFIDEQLDAVYTKLRNTENTLQSYKMESKFAGNENFSGVVISRLENMQDELVSVELEESILSEIEKSFAGNKEIDVYKMLPLLAGTRFEQSISSHINSLQDLLRRKENVQYNVTQNSEEVRSLNYQIDIQKKLILESIKSLKDKLQIRRKNLAVKVKELEGKFFGLPAEEIEFARIQRLFTINEKFYNLLLEKKAEYSISKAGFVSQNLILEPAAIPSSPVSPDRNTVLLVSFLVGTLVNILLIIILYVLHNVITTVYDISRQTQAPVLGIVPLYKKDVPVSHLLVDKNPKSILAEAFRSIRTNLQFVSNIKGPKIVAVTSTIAGEGKTFTVVNLAGIIAYSDKKVIILDSDMRKPKIHLGFGMDNDKGMSTILSGIHRVDQCIKQSSTNNLDIIPAGPIPPNPSELIINPRMEETLEYLKERYDYIIIDNPPIGIVADGVTLVQKADYPIYVFKAGFSKKYFIQNVERLVRNSHITNLSVILNSVDLGKSRYGYKTYNYGYGYGYGYSYGYGYYSEESPTNHQSFISKIFGRKQHAY